MKYPKEIILRVHKDKSGNYIIIPKTLRKYKRVKIKEYLPKSALKSQ